MTLCFRFMTLFKMLFCRAKLKPTEDITGTFVEFFRNWKYPMKAHRNFGKCFIVNFGIKQKIDDLAMLTMSVKNNSRYDNVIITPISSISRSMTSRAVFHTQTDSISN